MKPKHDKLLSNFAFNFNLRHYTTGKCFRTVMLMSDAKHAVLAFRQGLTLVHFLNST